MGDGRDPVSSEEEAVQIFEAARKLAPGESELRVESGGPAGPPTPPTAIADLHSEASMTPSSGGLSGEKAEQSTKVPSESNKTTTPPANQKTAPSSPAEKANERATVPVATPTSGRFGFGDRSVAAAILSACFLLGVVAVIASQLSGSDESTGAPTPSGPTSSASPPQLSDVETRILSKIPEAIASTCTSNTAKRFQRALGSVSCSSGDVTVFFDQFASSRLASEALNGVADQRRIHTYGSGWCGNHQNRLSGYNIDDGRHLGTVACFYSKNRHSWIIWTRSPTKLLGYATRSDRNSRALFRWWDSTGSKIR